MKFKINKKQTNAIDQWFKDIVYPDVLEKSKDKKDALMFSNYGDLVPYLYGILEYRFSFGESGTTTKAAYIDASLGIKHILDITEYDSR